MKKRFLAFMFLGVASCAAKLVEGETSSLKQTPFPVCQGKVTHDLIVKGKSLKAGGDYIFDRENTRLYIDGDLPKNVKLDVIGGPLRVNGNIGDGVFIRVQAPKECVNDTVQVMGRIGKSLNLSTQLR